MTPWKAVQNHSEPGPMNDNPSVLMKLMPTLRVPVREPVDGDRRDRHWWH
jgi:hypothetical protein